MRRLALCALALAGCLAWTGGDADEADGAGGAAVANDDTSEDACVKECKETDHRSCKAVCDAGRWPSCSVSDPGR